MITLWATLEDRSGALLLRAISLPDGGLGPDAYFKKIQLFQ
jgi:hypothetical protein